MKTIAVIPIRYADCCQEDGSPRNLLREKPLWQWTFEVAAAAKSLEHIIVAYDDDRFLPFLDGLDPRFIPFKRPDFLSGEGYKSLDVLTHVAKGLPDPAAEADYMMLLEITHPLRPKGLLEHIIELMSQNPADSLVTVRPVHYNFWKRDSSGVRRIVGSGDDPVTDMYSELIGIGGLFSRNCLLTDNPFGDSSALVPIEGIWSQVDVRDTDDLWLAEATLALIGSE
jgi:CMP-N-acetylneuraminic acid synthetase